MRLDQDRSDRLLKKQILNLNRHIPRQRKAVSELIAEDKPHVMGVDGSRHRFKRKELEFVVSMLSDSELDILKLPIYIEMDTMASGARVSGKLETRILCKILEREECPADEIFIYRPEMRIIRQKLPTVTQYMFLVR
ncbi:MAG TPA: DUF61 family protein [Methanobacteriaceae archaeon]|jgi:uncharacterized protein (UPF0216 family)|nr:DUF61 family protein [Euryarchaeota archaeon]HNR25366.1 DUF61 family protein [Methanobacteriaceae archaeon]HNS24721.1 DUF61 family protein [Methanobacteriaceae archaeon]